MGDKGKPYINESRLEVLEAALYCFSGITAWDDIGGPKFSINDWT